MSKSRRIVIKRYAIRPCRHAAGRGEYHSRTAVFDSAHEDVQSSAPVHLKISGRMVDRVLVREQGGQMEYDGWLPRENGIHDAWISDIAVQEVHIRNVRYAP